jgi:peroxiredoxin 2/4
MIKIGKKVPDFSCEAVINKQIKKVSLSDFDGKYKLILFYPLDFTFVCPTELLALQDNLEEFKKLNVEVMAVSVDSAFSHLAWLNTPREKGGIQGVNYTILSDIKKTISIDYSVLIEEEGVALRGVFLLDKDNVVQSATINNLSLGRSISELLRLVKALQFVEKNGEVCPANWEPGKKSMKPDQKGLQEYFAN